MTELQAIIIIKKSSITCIIDNATCWEYLFDCETIPAQALNCIFEDIFTLQQQGYKIKYKKEVEFV